MINMKVDAEALRPVLQSEDYVEFPIYSPVNN
jgi:hypothetical protein